MNLFQRADKHLKDDLINKLLIYGYTKMEDGRQLYELSLQELKELYRLEVQRQECI